MVETFTAKVAREPGKGFIHFRPDLQVTGVPVIRKVVLLANVAENSDTKKNNKVSSYASYKVSKKQTFRKE